MDVILVFKILQCSSSGGGGSRGVGGGGKGCTHKEFVVRIVEVEPEVDLRRRPSSCSILLASHGQSTVTVLLSGDFAGKLR